MWCESGDRRRKEMNAGEQGGDAAEVVHDHLRAGGGALATLFKHNKQENKENNLDKKEHPR